MQERFCKLVLMKKISEKWVLEFVHAPVVQKSEALRLTLTVSSTFFLGIDGQRKQSTVDRQEATRRNDELGGILQRVHVESRATGTIRSRRYPPGCRLNRLIWRDSSQSKKKRRDWNQGTNLHCWFLLFLPSLLRAWCDRYGGVVLDVVKKEFKDHVGEMETKRNAAAEGRRRRRSSDENRSVAGLCRGIRGPPLPAPTERAARRPWSSWTSSAESAFLSANTRPRRN
ncbi:uncharacterized protein LOC144701711 [Wolffia australiana]